MVKCSKETGLMQQIDKLAAVVGGSMGGMQTLQWIVSYPEMMKKKRAIATTARSSCSK